MKLIINIAVLATNMRELSLMGLGCLWLNKIKNDIVNICAVFL